MGNLLFNPNPNLHLNPDSPVTVTDWMHIAEKEIEFVDELYELEHPLKQASYSLIYSDILYYLTCKKKKYKCLRDYREYLEHN